jgi:hypothetical protein
VAAFDNATKVTEQSLPLRTPAGATPSASSVSTRSRRRPLRIREARVCCGTAVGLLFDHPWVIGRTSVSLGDVQAILVRQARKASNVTHESELYSRGAKRDHCFRFVDY